MKLTFNEYMDNDCLFVTLKPSDHPVYENHENITVIKENDEIVGLNIFNAHQSLGIDSFEHIRADEQTVNTINNLLDKHGIEEISPDLTHKFVIGHVDEIEPHPDSDHLQVTKVDVGTEVLQIVCGAPNVDKNQKVVVAKVGAFMPDGSYIKPSELRGVASNGMICSKKELGLPHSGAKGIYVLDDGKVGDEFNL